MFANVDALEHVAHYAAGDSTSATLLHLRAVNAPCCHAVGNVAAVLLTTRFCVADDASNDDDEFNVSLAKMEEEIKPKILNILQSLNKNYSKLQKYQIEKLECLLNSKELSVSKNKNFKKIQEILVDNFKNLQLAPHVVEELV